MILAYFFGAFSIGFALFYGVSSFKSLSERLL